MHEKGNKKKKILAHAVMLHPSKDAQNRLISIMIIQPTVLPTSIYTVEPPQTFCKDVHQLFLVFIYKAIT